MQVTTIGLDLAKRVFQVHGVDAAGKVAVRRKLQRSEMADFFAGLPSCRVGIEACATAHHFGFAGGCQQDGQDRLGGDGAAGGLPQAGHGRRRLTR